MNIKPVIQLKDGEVAEESKQRTRSKALAYLNDKVRADAPLERLAVANHVQNKDAWRVTLTWPVINRGAQVFFLIGGADKAQILKEVFSGPRDSERLPSQLISPASGILTLLLDRAAAAQLPAPDAQGYGVLERIE